MTSKLKTADEIYESAVEDCQHSTPPCRECIVKAITSAELDLRWNFDQMTIQKWMESTNTLQSANEALQKQMQSIAAPKYYAYIRTWGPQLMAALGVLEKLSTDRVAEVGALKALAIKIGRLKEMPKGESK